MKEHIHIERREKNERDRLQVIKSCDLIERELRKLEAICDNYHIGSSRTIVKWSNLEPMFTNVRDIGNRAINRKYERNESVRKK